MLIEGYDKEGNATFEVSDIKRFVALDFETMDSMRSTVCAVGVCVFEEDKIVDTFYSLICPPSKAENKYCVRLHGIHYRDVKDAPDFPTIWEKINNEYIKDSPIVIHNISFERTCINECKEFFGTKNEYNYIDTLKLSRKKLKLPKNTLDKVCRKLNVKLRHHHNALDDAKACGEVFIKIREKFYK